MVSILALLVLFIPLAFLALLVRLLLGKPLFFTQVRAGRDGKPFNIVKFRSMRNAVDASGNDLPDEQRLTKFGKILRSTSLDELPELWNVIRGDMSLVGPRPLHMVYIERYTTEQKRRLDALPGITGWAQVNGRNAISWEEKFDFDVWYVDHRTFWLDVKILCMTVGKVFKRQGISSAEHATFPEFMGYAGEQAGNAGPRISGRQEW